MDNEELPEGWQEAPLLELCELIRGVSYTKGEESHTSGKGFVPLLRANNIDRELKFDDLYFVPERYVKPKQFLQQGDALFAMSSGSKTVVGKAATVNKPFDGTFGAFCGVLRPSSKVDWKFFGYFFQTKYYRDRISEASAGVNINNLKREYFEAISFPVPPLAEQQRIVSRVEALLSHVNVARDRLSRVPLIMKKFRQAVLAAACSGRLTEGWREEKPDGCGIESIDQGGYDSILPYNLDTIDALPKGWASVNLKKVATCRLGKMLDKIKNQGILTPYIRNINVRWFEFDFSDIKEIKIEEHERDTYSLRCGDILICEGGEPGRCAIWNGSENEYVFQKALHRVRIGNNILPEYLCFCLKDATNSGRLSTLFTGTTIKHLTGVSLKQFQFPLPPLAEQHEIVRRVGLLFECADAFDREVVLASRRCERLTQGVLGKAFAGKL